MGRTARPRPKFLSQKLLDVRLRLGLSQNEMLVRLGLEKKLKRNAISGYEIGTTEPPMPTVLKYARVAGICTDVLLDDELDLPIKLPSRPRHR